MTERQDEGRIPELEALRAPRRTDAERQRARQRILSAANPLLERRLRSGSSWTVLAAWSRPGLIAASFGLALILAALGTGRYGGANAAQPAALEDALRAPNGSGAVPALLLAVNEPDSDAVLEVALLDSDSNGGDER